MKVKKTSHWRQDIDSGEMNQLRGALDTLPPSKVAAWQSFWVCPRCGNEKAWKFRESDREWIECGQCEYYEEK